MAFSDVTSPFLNTGNVLVKEIEIDDDQMNLARFRYEGDYDDGKLIDLFAEKKSIVTEEEIDQKYDNLLYRKYSQSDIVLSMHSNDVLAEQIKEWMNKLWQKKQKEIDMYKNSNMYIYESRELQKKRQEEILKP